MEYVNALAPVDIAALGLILLNTILGLVRGFAHQLTRLIILIGGLVAGRTLADDVAPLVNRVFSGIRPPADQIVAYFVLFFGVLLIGSLLGYLMRNMIRALRLESFDHLLGALLGALKGATFVVIGVLVASHLTGMPKVQDALHGTEASRLTKEVVDHVTPLFSEPVRERFQTWSNPDAEPK